VRLSRLQTKKEDAMDDTTLKELQNEIRHMDEPELLALGRQHRASPDSVEYLEAQAEYLRGQKKKREIPDPQPVGPTSEEFSAMANAAGDRYPWMWYPKDSVR
jgi:hypothetical protein